MMHTPSPNAPDDSCGPVEEVRRRITAEVTRLIAALSLADEKFPHADDLPRVARLPYQHLGHQVLFDHDKLASILWGTVREIQEAVRGNPWRYIAPLLGLLYAAGTLVSGVFLALRAGPYSGNVPIMIGLNLLVALVIYRLLRPNIEKIAAEVRARNLRLLLRGVDPPSAEQFWLNEMATKDLAAWGDGALEKGKAPVLVLTGDQEPFPGFGRHQARELYICRPDDADKPPELSAEALNTAVSDALVRMVRGAGVSCVTAGKVVLIDGRTLRRGSLWLVLRGEEDTAQAPPLFLSEDRLASVPEIDKRASARVYTCIQAVVPEYLMCVTFFVRTFLAGNSAACEVNVSTLGPPLLDWDYVRTRLRVHDRERGEGRLDVEDPTRGPSAVTPLGARLRAIRNLLATDAAVFKSPVSKAGALRLEAIDTKALEHEKEQADQIAEGSELWPGFFVRPDNWRERYSLTFTNDFFGNTESRAILKTLYDRICRSALSQLKELGFDISDYQDESGKFTLKAESIEQLVVGERVYMEPKARKAEEQRRTPGPGAEAAA